VLETADRDEARIGRHFLGIQVDFEKVQGTTERFVRLATRGMSWAEERYLRIFRRKQPSFFLC
jgi:hypothetical protein